MRRRNVRCICGYDYVHECDWGFEGKEWERVCKVAMVVTSMIAFAYFMVMPLTLTVSNPGRTILIAVTSALLLLGSVIDRRFRGDWRGLVFINFAGALFFSWWAYHEDNAVNQQRLWVGVALELLPFLVWIWHVTQGFTLHNPDYCCCICCEWAYEPAVEQTSVHV